ncbi:L-fuculose-phosphate aldolase [Capronia coronata CBS 617.96]|uniref:L-fuculose-phosphate aldolase n=1 Tax=Capronia coronata CBS 617.96 TaxID=1182541 RepID=W9ZMP8_9EURO|nr:L-fuculose-phosphate aldolase [Capronia coronata CBS 617.96]EXJ95774.1 L-fuculose-phosphate aldolase [Capronia coronata CBS 617.96]
MAPGAIYEEAVPAGVTGSKTATTSTTSTAAEKEQQLTPLESMAHRANSKPLPKIPTFTDMAAKRQWQLEHMAGCFRVWAREGYAEGISGHISVRDPEFEDRMWINPLGVHYGMLKASDMVCINYMTGEVVGGNMDIPANAAGVQIHSAAHKRRPDVHAVCHAHSIYGRAYSAFAQPLEMLTQDVCNFYNAHSIYRSYGGVALAAEEGDNIAKALGDGKAAILMNHGLLTVGHTVDEAAFQYMVLERSCKVQLLVEAAEANGRLQKKVIGPEEAAYNFKMNSDPETLYFEMQSHLRYEEYLSGGDYKN